MPLTPAVNNRAVRFSPGLCDLSLSQIYAAESSVCYSGKCQLKLNKQRKYCKYVHKLTNL